MKRRDFFYCVASLLGLAFAGQVKSREASLGSAASISNRLYGAAVRGDLLQQDGAYRRCVLANCSSITPELALKWAALQPQPDQFDFSEMDYLMRFAKANGMAVYGHTLLWHESIPAWALEPMATKKDWGIIQRYMETVLGRLAGSIRYWDVVNEPIDTVDGVDGLRNSPFLAAFGPDYIPNALRTARMLAPAARLMINEFGVEYDLAVEDDRRSRLLKLLETLRKGGVPIDGLGLQAHLELAKGQVSQQKLKPFLDAVADLGLEIYVTELDVREGNYAQAPDRRDRDVADAVSRYLDIVMPYSNLRGITTWGICDRYSWLQITPEDLAKYGDIWKDGSGPGLNRGLPFDASMQPKPFSNALLQAFSDSRVKYGRD